MVDLEEFVPHQRTDLYIERDVLNVRSEPISTPGSYVIRSVRPGSRISVRIKAEMGAGCASFLYVADDKSGEEVTRRNTTLGRGGTDEPVSEDRYTFVDIPMGVSEVRIGLLFSSSSSAESYKMKIQLLEIVDVNLFDSLVDWTYVLSLENEKEKFSICEREAQRHSISLNRWKAVNGYSSDNMKNWEDYMESPWSELDKKLGRKAIDRPGAWGYMLTMKGIFEDAIKNEYSTVAIFDDDFILSKTFTHDFSKFIERVGTDWDVLYLGASQWAWDGIEVSPSMGYYSPTKNTNGTFAVIYKSSVFEELIYEIRKMQSPFDSGPLGELVTSKFKDSSYVAFPNISIANVEKPGIRDSRSQTEYAKRFRWRLDDFPGGFTEWSMGPKVVREEWPEEFGPKEVNRVIGVTTFNRIDYLVDFVQSFEDTITKDDNWCLIIADDGSSDGTMEWLLSEYEQNGFGLIVIKNDSLGIARQSNSIIDRMMKLKSDEIEVLFMCNDDIRFEKEGWSDLYVNSMRENDVSHLVYFNPEWKDPDLEEYAGEKYVLKASVMGRNVMGCFFTITPELVEEIGYFDEGSFPVRGHSHIDYTIRACNSGFNNLDAVFDVVESNQYIKMERRETYVGTHKILGMWEHEQVYSKSSLKKRESLLEDGSRKYVQKGW
mgnify:CR=1 FL=1